MQYASYSKEQLKELLREFLELAEIKDFKMLKNDFFLENVHQKPRSNSFRLIVHYLERFGKEEFKETITEFETELSNQVKLTFLNMNLEPRFLNEQTEEVVANRHKAFELYKKEPEMFHLQLESEPENSFDENAIAVYAEGKRERMHLGYISRSFNLRIGKLLAKDEFPFIQANYQDIINGKYSVDNLIIDIYF